MGIIEAAAARSRASGTRRIGRSELARRTVAVVTARHGAIHGGARGRGFNGAGWGLTKRVCPNLDVIGTARTIGACTPVDASRASSLSSAAPLGKGDSVEIANRLSGLQSRLERLKEAMAAAMEDKANKGTPDRLQEMMATFLQSEASWRVDEAVEGKKVKKRCTRRQVGVLKSSPTRGPPVRRANVKGEDSDCHVLDLKESHRCVDDGDCGVDAQTCSPRKCSEHKFCFTAP